MVKVNKKVNGKDILNRAKEVFISEEAALKDTAKLLGNGFIKAVNLVSKSGGRLVVVGIGKSGHIGRKISATLASTGTPSFFVHPTEALHGDLGMITAKDIVLALSFSGETEELSKILTPLKKEDSNLYCGYFCAQSNMNLSRLTLAMMLAAATHKEVPSPFTIAFCGALKPGIVLLPSIKTEIFLFLNFAKPRRMAINVACKIFTLSISSALA